VIAVPLLTSMQPPAAGADLAAHTIGIWRTQVRFIGAGANVTTDATIPTGRFLDLVVTMADDGELTVFVDGQRAGGAEVPDGGIDGCANRELRFAGNQDGGERLTGEVDRIAIFPRLLSEQDRGRWQALAFNRAPEISAVDADPSRGVAPLTVAFSVTASDPDGDALSYSWDFGDGNSSDQQNPTHTYTEPGTYEAELTVSDGELSASGSVTVTVTVGEPSIGEPELRLRAQPRVVKVSKRKRLAKLRMRVTNTGDAPSGPLTLCVKAPKKKLAVKGKACLTRPSIDPGQTAQRAVKLRVKPKARGKVTRVKLIARGPNVDNKRTTVRVRAR
jgi:hypothetical protein